MSEVYPRCTGHARPVHLGRRLVVQRLVRTSVVVETEVLIQVVISLLRAGIFVEIDFLVFYGVP